jgi:hypothetical protein
MVRITLDAYNPILFDLDQKAAGIGTILGANRSLPHGRPSAF